MASQRRRGAQLVRTLKLIEMLQNGRVSMSTMQREASVCRRTLIRDLNALREAHLPVGCVRGEDGRTYWSMSKAVW